FLESVPILLFLTPRRFLKGNKRRVAFSSQAEQRCRRLETRRRDFRRSTAMRENNPSRSDKKVRKGTEIYNGESLILNAIGDSAPAETDHHKGHRGELHRR